MIILDIIYIVLAFCYYQCGVATETQRNKNIINSYLLVDKYYCIALIMLLLLLITTFVIAFVVFIYLKLRKPYQYWKERGIPFLKPWLIFGNMAPIVFRTKAMAHVLEEAYTHFHDKRYFGFFTFSTPTLIITDLDLIKRICIKDFDKFTDHTDFLPATSDPFWKRGLFAREGKDWHDMRNVLTPAFTGSKMRSMFCLMVECAEDFLNYFQKQPGIITMDMRDTVTRFTNDVIASCAFGIKCDSLRQRNNEFFLMGKDAFDFTGFKGLKFFGGSVSPKLMEFFKISLFDEKMKSFFRKVVRDTIKHRDETGLIRPDMIHLLRQAQKGLLQQEDDSSIGEHGFAAVHEYKVGKTNDNRKTEITQEDITAQAVIFFFGGYDTVAYLLCNMAYEIAVNPDVQEKLIQEVDDTLNDCNGKITYEALLKMKYLDMVTSETLRLWAALFLNRKAVKPYTIEPVLPGEKPLHIEVGTDCMIPLFAIQRDPKYFTNPNKFDPERFSDANKRHIDQFTFMPFGTGPRSCIGNRFALMESKLLIFSILSRFEIVPVEKTAIPFVLSKDTIIPKNEKGYWLGLKPRTNIM